MLENVRRFVTDSFGKENLHLERTLFWVRELEPEAGEELLLAAVSHDIERAFNPETKDMREYRTGAGQRQHEEEGGRIMFEFLAGAGYDRAKAERVRELIARHETGGDKEQDLLRDADSLSWLEVSAPRHIMKKLFPPEEMTRKVEDMYARIGADRARELATPFHAEAVRLLAGAD